MNKQKLKTEVKITESWVMYGLKYAAYLLKLIYWEIKKFIQKYPVYGACIGVLILLAIAAKLWGPQIIRFITAPRPLPLTTAPKNSGYEYAATDRVRGFSALIGQSGTNTPKVQATFPEGNTVDFVLTGLNQNISKPSKSGNKVVFKDVRTNVDIAYQTLTNGIKEDIIVKQPSEGNGFTFTLNNFGATPKKIAPETFGPVFYDTNGNYVFHFAKPFATDAKGARTDNVVLAIHKTDKDASYKVTIIVNQKWLNDPARAYPVTIDPTVVYSTSTLFSAGQFNRVTDTGPTTGFSGGGAATGGTITTSGGYTIHTFTSSGTFTPPGTGNVEVLVVGAGGGGGSETGGGGGGGIIYNSSYAVTTTPITVTVGPGNANANGSNSVFGSLTAVGGGVGGPPNSANGAGSGGSGGGGGRTSTVTTNGGAGTSGQGNAGGTASTASPYGAAGGGGAGAAGGAGGATAGNGGVGLPYSISGSSVYYGGGGGEVGGTGGGASARQSGATNTGGGAGSDSNHTGGNVSGGSGIVIVRYPTTYSALPNLTTYYQELPADQNTADLFHFNETSGNPSDSSGNGNTGTLNGTTIVSGMLGSARSFTTGDYISHSTNGISPSAATIEMWVKPSWNGNDGAIHGLWQNNNAVNNNQANWVSLFKYSNNLLYFRVMDPSAGFHDCAPDASSYFTSGQWTHIAAAYDSTGSYLYINGSLVCSLAPYAVPNAALDTNGRIGFGHLTSFGSGVIDEVRISKVVRSPEEIKLDAQRRPYSVYTSDVIDLNSVTSGWNSLTWTELGVSTGDGETLKDATNLVAQWNFNNTSSTTTLTNDAGSCSTSCNGTLTNMTSTGQDAAAASGWTANNKHWGAGALMFDGTNDTVVVGSESSFDFENNQAFSIGAWIKTNNLAQESIFSKGAYSAPYTGYDLFLNNGRVYLMLNNTWTTNTLQVHTNNNIADGNWHYVAMTYNGTSNASGINIYTDGLLQGIGTDYNSLSASILNNISPNIGSRNNQATYFNGVIDSVTVFSRALTANEILSNYNAGNVELQTRVGNTTDPNDGSWEAWKPTDSETSIDNMDNPLDYATPSASIYNRALIATSSATMPLAEGAKSLKIQTGQPWLDPTTVGLWHMDETGGSGAYIKDSSGLSTIPSATGGTITTSGGYTIHTFTSGGTFTPSGSGTVEVLVVGGGGSGAGTGTGEGEVSGRGGGGAGGVITNSSYLVSAGAMTVTVGNGGSTNTSGGNSVFGTLTAVGGGRGATTSLAAGSGGSGGGGNYNQSPGSGTTGQGNAGGTGYTNGSTYSVGGGGGGANAVGQSTNSGTQGGYGGDGISSSISGTATYYGGGGGGGGDSRQSKTGGAGGNGGGGAGSTGVGTNGTANTGGGGGGGGYNAAGGNGGTGIVIVRYPTTPVTTYSNGTPTGTTVVNGISGKARSFNGTSDYIDTGNIGNFTNITVSLWIKPTSMALGWLIGKDEASGRSFAFGIQANGKLVSQINGLGGTQTDNTTNIVAGKWQHLTYTYNGTNVIYYINGVQDGSNNFAVVINSTTTPVNIGRRSYSGSESYFSGVIDEVKISNVIRTAEEIAEDYRAGRDHYINRTISTTDLSSKQKLEFNVTADRPGTYLSATIGNNAFVNYQTDANTVGLWHMDDAATPLSGSLTPNSVSGLSLWLKADALSLSDGQAVSSWTDSSGNGRNLTQGTGSKQPVYKAGIVNGLPVIRFTAASVQEISNATNFTTPTTVIYIARETGGANQRVLTGVANNWLLGFWSGAKNQAYFAGWVTPSGSPATDTGWHVFSGVETGAVSSVYADGSLVASNASGVAGPNGISIGCWTATECSNADVTEVLIYNSALSDENREKVENYLYSKYNVSRVSAYSYTKDASGNASDGKTTGTTLVQGKIGKARSFNGSSDYISIPDSSNWTFGTGDLTVDFWVNFNALPANGLQQDLVSQWTAGNVGWGEEIENGIGGNPSGTYSLRFFNSNGMDFRRTVSVATNTWYHLAFVRSGNNHMIFLDGVQQGATEVNAAAFPDSTEKLAIGVLTASSPGRYLNGTIDEVRISKGIARSAADIRAAYEVGARTHNVTIDFGAKLDSGNLITGSGDTGFTVDGTYYGLNQKGSNLYLGDKIIVRENYNGTTYIAQGTVNGIVPATGAVTVASWDAGSTFPSGGQTGFSANADVFKWQREYFDLGGSLSTQRNAVTQLSLRQTNGQEGRTIWLDDLRSAGTYLSNPATTNNITSSTGDQYFQYRIIQSSFDTNVSTSVTSATIDFTTLAPNTPTIGAASNITATTVDWGFTDTASNELGFKVYDTTNALKATCDGTNLSSCTETGLTPNTSYTRKVVAYNANGNSLYSSTATAVTLAAVPATPTTSSPTATTLSLTPNAGTNPAATELAIYQQTGTSCTGSGGFYLKADGTTNGSTAVWQTAAAWGTLAITGLNLDTTEYSFCVKARNSNNVETAFSSTNATNGGYLPTSGNFTMVGNMTFASAVRLTDGNNGARKVVGLDLGPAGLWTMNEASGNALDTSGYGFTGTPTGTSVVTGKYGNARSFNGTSSDYITVSENDKLDPAAITIDAWIKPNVMQVGDIVNKGDDSGYRLLINANGTLTFKDRGATNSVTTHTQTALVSGAWYHVAATGDSTGLKIYINGLLDQSNATPYGSPNTSSNLLMGKLSTNSEFYSGALDDVHIYSAALSVFQITQDMNTAANHQNVSIFTVSSGTLTVLQNDTVVAGSFVFPNGTAGQIFMPADKSGQLKPSVPLWYSIADNDGDGYLAGDSTKLYYGASPTPGRRRSVGLPTSGGTDCDDTSSAIHTTLITGGTITTGSGYKIHTFTGGGTLTVSCPASLSVDYLVVGGGGGGAMLNNGAGGGGGAGGLVYGSKSVNPASLSVTVGAGGQGAQGNQGDGSNGSDSVFDGITAVGGGHGHGGTGGSGGGGNVGTSGGAANQGNSGGGTGYGHNGGNGAGSGSAGGGGGSGGVGGTGSDPHPGGAGGAGMSFFGATYAAGGSGAADNGGAGGNATANTGNGGNGSRWTEYPSGILGGNGGSGVVIVRYLDP